MYIIIVGGGDLGLSLAKLLIEEGHEVVVVEKDPARFTKLSEEFGESAILGDGAELGTMLDMGANRADVLVAVTGTDQDNLIICQLAKIYFNVKRTIARANDSRNEYAMIQLGVDVTLNSTKIISQMINQEVSLEELSTLLKLKQGKLFIVQGKVSKKSPLTKKPIKDIKLPGNCIIVSILRKDDVIVPKGDTLIMANDEILVVTTPENEKHLNKLLAG